MDCTKTETQESQGNGRRQRHQETYRERQTQKDTVTERQTQRGQTAAELVTLPLVSLSAVLWCFLRVLAERGCGGPGRPCQVAGGCMDAVLLDLCFLLERSSSSSGSTRPAPGNWWATVGPGGWQGMASMGCVSDLEVSGAQQRPVGPAGPESRDERALLSRLRWGWQWRQAVQEVGLPLQLRGPADSGHTHDGVSPSPCADRRSRSSVRRYSHYKSRWPCVRSSSSSGCGGGQRRWSVQGRPHVPRKPAH